MSRSTDVAAGPTTSMGQRPGPTRPPPARGLLLRGAAVKWRTATVSCAALALLAYLLWILFSWAVLDSVFNTDAAGCRAASGACWSIVHRRYRLMLFGLYPYEDQWRSAIACVVVVLTVGSACLPRNWTASRMLGIWLGGYVLFLVLMRGGILGLDTVPTEQWGGLALTLFIYVTVIAFGFPLAIVIALVRQDGYPAFRWLTTLVVDLTRSLPLLTILFSAAIVLPLVLPGFLQGDKLIRSLVGFVFFFACYQSEIIRGGLQALPEGQAEAAEALGLGYVLRTALVTLPQAFRTSMPATINQFVITFKETSLVVIVGIFDFMASANAAYQAGEWTPYYREVFAFVAAVYFAGAFSLSRYGAYVERRFTVAKH